jgi:YVTN family beta-propeller protein
MKAYVVNSNSEDVSVIDTATNRVVATVPLGRGLQPGVASPDGKHVYVPDSCSDMIWVIDTASNEALRDGIQVGRAPHSMAVSPDGKTGYVTNLDAGTVSVIDTAKNAVVSTIQVGPNPKGVTFAVEGKRAYVARANRGDGRGGPGVGAVVVVDTANQSIVDTITIDALFDLPSAIAITPDGKQVYLSDGSGINVLDTASNKIVQTVFPKIDNSQGQVVPGGFGAGGMAVTPDGKFLYATLTRLSNPPQSFVWVIDTTTNTVVLPELWSGASWIAGLAVTPDGKSVYVATQRDEVFFDDVLVLDATTNTVVTTVRVRTAPVGVAMAPPR